MAGFKGSEQESFIFNCAKRKEFGMGQAVVGGVLRQVKLPLMLSSNDTVHNYYSIQ